MYNLDNDFTRRTGSVAVVGCGGTGSFVAEGLCRILPKGADIILIDHDRVEERNLPRSRFTSSDLEIFKSAALARRLSREYDRPVAYSTSPILFTELPPFSLIIGCVDNGPARRDIAKQAPGHWWIDAGNGENYGQVIIGNLLSKDLEKSFTDKGICKGLPLPTLQRPELLIQPPRVRHCSHDVADQDQGPNINQAMAVLALEVTRRLIEGICPWMQLWLDLENGLLTPVLATPEIVHRITGISERKLLEGGEP